MFHYTNNKRKCIVNTENFNKIKDKLKVIPFTLNKLSKAKPIFMYYPITNSTNYYIPFYFCQKYGILQIQEKEELEKNYSFNIVSSIILRKYQENIINIIVPKIIKEKMGGTISIPPGKGKTVISIYLLCLLKKKTIIFVHKSFLLNQWKERLIEFTNLEAKDIGIIQGNTYNIQNVTVCMIQTFLSRKFENLEDYFDFAIYDECHHISAYTFCEILKYFQTKYSIGLSATPCRQDKCEIIFENYIGPILYQENHIKKDMIKIQIHELDFSDDENYIVVKNKYTDQAQISTMITNLTHIKERNIYIIKTLLNMEDIDSRKILLLSDRRDHLKQLQLLMHEFLKNNNNYDESILPVFYLGGMKQELLNENSSKKIIFSTYSMSSEALDIPSLNTIILSTPRKSIEQSVGRILRKKHEKICPLIIDFKDKLYPFLNQFRTRKMYYHKISHSKIEFNTNLKN